MSVIYKITNLINNKIYVGQQSTTDKSYMGSGVILQKALKKYGYKNFLKEILEECSVESLDEREVFWIKELDATNPEIGYNIAFEGHLKRFHSNEVIS